SKPCLVIYQQLSARSANHSFLCQTANWFILPPPRLSLPCRNEAISPRWRLPVAAASTQIMRAALSLLFLNRSNPFPLLSHSPACFLLCYILPVLASPPPVLCPPHSHLSLLLSLDSSHSSHLSFHLSNNN
uniref:Uncharacterized protein n=1 Tax=Chrysemys picta bellii TaxID=8478 RepID=A0A8C3PEX2_CHRPI